MAEVADGSASVVSGVVCCWGGEGEQGTGSRTTRPKRLAAKSRPVERMLPLIVLLPLLTFTCNPDAEGLEQLVIGLAWTAFRHPIGGPSHTVLALCHRICKSIGD